MRKLLGFVIIATLVCWASFAYVKHFADIRENYAVRVDGVGTWLLSIVEFLVVAAVGLLALLPSIAWGLTLYNYPIETTYWLLGGCTGAWGILTAWEGIKASQLKRQQKFELKLVLWFVGLFDLVGITTYFAGGDEFPVIIVLCCVGALVLFLLLFAKDPSGIGGKARSAFKAISYSVLSPFFRTKTSYSRTYERRSTMSEPTTHTPAQGEVNAERAYKEAQQKVDDQKKEMEAVYVEIENEQPGLLAKPNLPDLGHKRLLDNIRTSIQATTIIKNVEKRTIILGKLDALQKLEITLIDNERLAHEAKSKLDFARKDSALVHKEIQTKTSKLEAERLKYELEKAQSQAEIDRLSKPAPVSRIQQKKEDIEEAELDDKLNKLKNPPPSPTPLTPTERIERELAGFKDLEAWRNSWPADMTPEDKALRQSIYNAKYGAIKERVRT